MDPIQKNDNSKNGNASEGNLGSGTVNALNNAVGNLPLGGIKGPQVAVQAVVRGFSAFLATHPWFLPILIALILVVGFTTVIVGGGGAPISASNPQISPIPTLTPTLAP